MDARGCTCYATSLQVLQGDGSILACAVNAAVSALVDAGIPMSTMLGERLSMASVQATGAWHKRHGVCLVVLKVPVPCPCQSLQLHSALAAPVVGPGALLDEACLSAVYSVATPHEMLFLLAAAAVSCAFTQDGQLLLDPDAAEEKVRNSVLQLILAMLA